MSFVDLHEGILEEFAEAAQCRRQDNLHTYEAWAEFLKAQHRKDCATYYGKQRLTPAFRAKNRVRAEKRRRALGIPVRK